MIWQANNILCYFSAPKKSIRARWSAEEMKILLAHWEPKNGKPERKTLDKLVPLLEKRTLMTIRTQCFNMLRKFNRWVNSVELVSITKGIGNHKIFNFKFFYKLVSSYYQKTGFFLFCSFFTYHCFEFIQIK